MNVAYNNWPIGARVVVKNVDGSTDRKGSKQNKTYTITGHSETAGFYEAKDENDADFTLWDSNKDGTELGLSKGGRSRYSYTKEFSVIL